MKSFEKIEPERRITVSRTAGPMQRQCARIRNGWEKETAGARFARGQSQRQRQMAPIEFLVDRFLVMHVDTEHRRSVYRQRHRRDRGRRCGTSRTDAGTRNRPRFCGADNYPRGSHAREGNAGVLVALFQSLALFFERPRVIPSEVRRASVVRQRGGREIERLITPVM